MESMRDIRTRITSVQKTMKITNAMYLMASSKLKKARKTLAETEPYFDSLQRAIAKIIAHTDLNNERFFATDRDIPADQIRHGYIIITSDTRPCRRVQPQRLQGGGDGAEEVGQGPSLLHRSVRPELLCPSPGAGVPNGSGLLLLRPATPPSGWPGIWPIM